MASYQLKSSILLVGLALACISQMAHAQATMIRADRMLDVVTGRMHGPAVIIVEGDRIGAVNPRSLPPEARVHDLGDVTLLPGLIDSHTHLMDEPAADWVRQRVYETPATWTLRAVRTGRLALLNGFTTVRDVGSTGFVDVAMMRASEAGWIEAPRVIPVGHYITPTGGHCDLTGFAPGILDRGTDAGVADGPDAVRRAVRYQIKHGAKWIKVCPTAGVLSFESDIGAQQMTEAEIRAAVEEAEMHHVRVAAHAHGTAGILAAVRAGVRSIEHGSMLTPEAIRLMKEHGTWLVPQAHLGYSLDRNKLPPIIRAKAERVQPLLDTSLEQAIRAGVPIAFSTDGPLPGNDPWQEFVRLVERGMTPVQAIQAATIHAAKLLELDDRGRLAPGLLADVIAVAGDPTQQIGAMKNVVFVMKGGATYKQP